MRDVFETLLKKRAEINIGDITDDMSLRDELGLDSLNIAMLYPDIEDAFDLRFSPLDDDLGEIFKTVGSLWRYVESKGRQK